MESLTKGEVGLDVIGAMDTVRQQIGQIAFAINQIKGEQFGYVGTALPTDSWPDAFLKMPPIYPGHGVALFRIGNC
jgi:hypothetical protein